jgi:small conductance mechanosensitive channel
MQFLFSSRVCVIAALVFLCQSVSAQPITGEGEREAPELLKSEQLLEEIEAISAEFRALKEQIRKVTGEERTAVNLHMRDLVLEFIRKVDKLVEDVTNQREKGVKRPTGLKRTRALLLEMDRSIPEFIDELESAAADYRTELADTPEETRDDLEIQLRGVEETIDEVYPFFFEHLRHRELLGLEAGAGRKQLESRLTERVSGLAGRVTLLSHHRAEARKAADESPDDPAIQAKLRVANEKLDAAASSLWTTCDVMDELGVPTAQYRKVLLRGTGEISSDLLDLDVVADLFEDGVEGARRWLERRGPPLLARIALFAFIVGIFWVIGRLARRVVEHLADKSENVSELSRRILVGAASRTVLIFGVLVALTEVGVNVTALLAGLGIVGFIIGFALQDTIGNFASGTMILLYRPFDVGDVIEVGTVYGVVHGMSLVSTTIRTFDNQSLVVPNTKIWGDVIRNVTDQKIRRMDLEFSLAHSVEVERAEEVFGSILREHPKVLEDPKPVIHVHKLTEYATQFIVRPWVNREDYWPVYWELMREIKLRLDREEIPMGIPRHDVQLHGETTG